MRPQQSKLFVRIAIVSTWTTMLCAAEPATRPQSSPAQIEARELREELFGGDLSDPYGLGLDTKDARVKTIDRLTRLGTPEAVDVLGASLSTEKAGRKLKQRALLALGTIGSQEAVEAIRQFEAWAEARRADMGRPRFGKTESPIDHIADYEIKPLAESKDSQGTPWVVFRWQPHLGDQLSLWVTRSLGNDRWSTPMYLDLPGVPLRAESRKPGLEVFGKGLKITLGDRTHEFKIDELMRDSDQDGLPDSLEPVIGTNPAKPDTDGDGTNDGRDGNPLTPRTTGQPDDEAEIRQAVFTMMFATCNSWETLVLVDKGDFAGQEYRGYGGFVVRSAKIRKGFVNITGLKINMLSPDRASVTTGDWEGEVAGSGHEVRLRKIHGKWVVFVFKMTWIS